MDFPRGRSDAIDAELCMGPETTGLLLPPPPPPPPRGELCMLLACSERRTADIDALRGVTPPASAPEPLSSDARRTEAPARRADRSDAAPRSACSRAAACARHTMAQSSDASWRSRPAAERRTSSTDAASPTSSSSASACGGGRE
eukprot:129596-Chlamydomonas_euryale.AAC.1